MKGEEAEGESESTPERESSREEVSEGTSAESTSAAGASVEFTRTTAFLVCRSIAPGETRTVRKRIAERRPSDESVAAWLLPGDDVVTVSLFLVDRDEMDDALIWYVEVESDDGAWADPAETLGKRSPLYDDFGELLTGDACLYGDSERVIHASNSNRPGRPQTADVVLVRVGIEPGPPTWLARFVAGTIDLLEGTRVGRRFESSSGDVIENERMWTETLFLDDSDGDYAILWYMEADDMDRVMEVYETTDNRVARWSEVVLDYLFEEPMRALGDPMDANEYELLVHETNAARR